MDEYGGYKDLAETQNNKNTWRLSDELLPHLGLTFDLTVKRNSLYGDILYNDMLGGGLGALVYMGG